jgi:hypothetical protein
MGFWEPATHMTKGEWRAACLRSQHRLEGVNAQMLDLGKRKR